MIAWAYIVHTRLTPDSILSTGLGVLVSEILNAHGAFMTFRSISLCTALLFSIGACASADSDEGVEGSSESITLGRKTLVQMLDSVPADAKWDSLTPAFKHQLLVRAQKRRADYREEWAASGLASKEFRLLYRANAKTLASFNAYVQQFFGEHVPENFSATTGVKNAALLRGLKKLFLVTYASMRLEVTENGFSDTDWNGEQIKETFLNDAKTLADQEAYAGRLASEFEGISPSALNPLDQKILNKAIFAARSFKFGTMLRSFGPDYATQAWGPAEASYVISANHVPGDDGKPRAYSDEESVARDMNALVFGDVSSLYMGSLSAGEFFMGLNTDSYFADAGADTARRLTQLAHWWSERINKRLDAAKTCKVFSSSEQSRVGESFAADFLLPPAEGALVSIKSKVDARGAEFLTSYQAIVSQTVELVFADAPLSPASLAAVKTAIAGERRLGSLVTTAAAAIKSNAGDAAATKFQLALDSVPMIGGGYLDTDTNVKASDAAALNAMWQEVVTWLSSTYPGGPVVIRENLPATLTLTTGTTSSAGQTGDITLGVGEQLSKSNWYEIMLHEGLHALHYKSKQNVQGWAIEGSSVLVESETVKKFFDATRTPKESALYRISQLPMAVRRLALTDATLSQYLRTSCPANAPDAKQFPIDIVRRWGASDSVIEEAPGRANLGTQFLTYLTGELIYRDTVGYFETQIQPSVDNKIDSYSLAKCGMAQPAKSPEAVAKLRSCLSL